MATICLRSANISKCGRQLQFATLIITAFIVSNAAHVHNREKIEDSWNSVHYKDGEHNAEFDREAILGRKEKVHEYHELSPEEAKRRLAILVTEKGMDANKDGYVDREELVQWVRQSFKSLAEEDGAERLKEEDANGDGLVSWDEHLTDNFSFDEKLDAEEDEMIREDKALWAAADLDKDGLLNAQEFAAFNSPEDFEFMHDALHKWTMDKRDVNRDGFLSFEEYVVDENGVAPEVNSETYIVEKDRFDQDYDLDKDGKLNKEEVLRWLIPDNDELAVTEAEHLIASSDGNGDGKLSVFEITHNHEIFVGSESTDFGERLKKMKDEL
ncbi:Reticulocalbin-2-like protein [Dinothrombium tinctorium]|uniref:Reticulocalbin-3 n=1 Tax=Dinothrombium tinctorium TaxID=1965070 RepID=A0A3S3P6K0_9ACAR|nr:Reticulocalbin-2-like protein [Dinothrombium tinctorium]RWS01271.1 Reticulocalbin-2-like protein [Dinothrombium tinctorium]RWS02137.1 Reticulocalbin-2-like protein [Dinothrombium tinctorium]